MAAGIAKAVKALVCKERRDSFVDTARSVDQTSASAGPPNLEELDWLNGPEGNDWLTSLRLSATNAAAEEDKSKLKLEEKKTPRQMRRSPRGNSENESSGANTSTGSRDSKKKAIPISSPLLSAAPPDLAKRAAASIALSGTPLPPPPQRTVSFGRTNSFGSQASFSMVASPARAQSSVNVSVVSSGDGSFHLGPAVTVQQPKLTPRGTRSPGARPAPQMHRSLSRGPSVEAKMPRSFSRGTPASPRHPPGGSSARRSASAQRGEQPYFGMGSHAKVEVAPPFADDLMPAPANEVVEPHPSGRRDWRGEAPPFFHKARPLTCQSPPTRSKSATVFWRPPPEAVAVCESLDFSSAFPTPPKVTESPQSVRKPPRAPVVAVAHRTYGNLPPPLDLSGHSPGPQLTPRLPVQASFPSQQSFPPLNTFQPSPPRHPSNTFMPSPRQLSFDSGAGIIRREIL